MPRRWQMHKAEEDAAPDTSTWQKATHRPEKPTLNRKVKRLRERSWLPYASETGGFVVSVFINTVMEERVSLKSMAKLGTAVT